MGSAHLVSSYARQPWPKSIRRRLRSLLAQFILYVHIYLLWFSRGLLRHNLYLLPYVERSLLLLCDFAELWISKRVLLWAHVYLYFIISDVPHTPVALVKTAVHLILSDLMVLISQSLIFLCWSLLWIHELRSLTLQVRTARLVEFMIRVLKLLDDLLWLLTLLHLSRPVLEWYCTIDMLINSF